MSTPLNLSAFEQAFATFMGLDDLSTTAKKLAKRRLANQLKKNDMKLLKGKIVATGSDDKFAQKFRDKINLVRERQQDEKDAHEKTTQKFRDVPRRDDEKTPQKKFKVPEPRTPTPKKKSPVESPDPPPTPEGTPLSTPESAKRKIVEKKISPVTTTTTKKAPVVKKKAPATKAPATKAPATKAPPTKAPVAEKSFTKTSKDVMDDAKKLLGTTPLGGSPIGHGGRTETPPTPFVAPPSPPPTPEDPPRFQTVSASMDEKKNVVRRSPKFEQVPLFTESKHATDTGRRGRDEITRRIDEAFGKDAPFGVDEPPFSLTNTPFRQWPSTMEQEVQKASRSRWADDLDTKYNDVKTDIPLNTVNPTFGTDRPALREVKFSPDLHDIPEIKEQIEQMGRDIIGEEMGAEGKRMLDQLQPQAIVNIRDSLRNRFRPERPPTRSSLLDDEVPIFDPEVTSRFAQVKRMAGQASSSVRGFVDGAVGVIDTVEGKLQPIRQLAGIASDIDTIAGTFLPDHLNPVRILTDKARELIGRGDDVDEDEKIRSQVAQINQPAGSSSGSLPSFTKATPQMFPDEYQDHTNVKLVQAAITNFFNDLNLYGNLQGVGTASDADVELVRN